MYSLLLRILYSFTYYIHIGMIGECYQIYKHGFWPSFSAEESWVEMTEKVLFIHYPIVFVIICLMVAKFVVCGSKKLASNTLQMKSSDPYSLETLYSGIQLIPYITFLFKDKMFGKWGASVLIIGTVLFLVGHGTYNLSLAILGYYQYRVKTENTTCWLITKRRLSNFSNSEKVHTLQDNVFVRHE